MFNLDLEKVVRSLLTGQSIEILNCNLLLEYADHVVIIDNFQNEVEKKTADLIKQPGLWVQK